MRFIRGLIRRSVERLLQCRVAVGCSPGDAGEHTIILFPRMNTTFCCGLAALVAYQGKTLDAESELIKLRDLAAAVKAGSLGHFREEIDGFEKGYLGGGAVLCDLLAVIRGFRRGSVFKALVRHGAIQMQLGAVAADLLSLAAAERAAVAACSAELGAGHLEIAHRRIEVLKDCAWCLEREVLENLDRVRDLYGGKLDGGAAALYKKVNAVLNSIDRLEVRGRDSSGISLLFVMRESEYDRFKHALVMGGLAEQYRQRWNGRVLLNNSITRSECSVGGESCVSLAFVYKVAAEIGSLGDNVFFLRSQIRNDQVLGVLAGFEFVSDSVSAHTRWASVGAITEANCHPVDNEPNDAGVEKSGIIHVCLNGDIDNYTSLKTEYEYRYDPVNADITTDTKIIPLQIEHYLRQGNRIGEAFRLAVNDFKGSHAISMHTDLAPGKLFLAQKGSGQTVFVGIGPDQYMAASEVYGIVEETQSFIKLNGGDRGQIVELDGNVGGAAGIVSRTYDGTPIPLGGDDVQVTEITSRDIDRQSFPHYFLKEISESPASVEKTCLNRWVRDEKGSYTTVLDETVLPADLADALENGGISHIYFIGQGTAGVAAQGCAHLLGEYLGAGMDVRAMKSSELSGFFLQGDSMSDYLVVAISQSGTTTDTNRTVDMVRARGARTLAIVNRRDSDLTFKVDGVLYTSTGRDVEMSVASTKAFYSQLTAGALLGIHVGMITGRMAPDAVSREIKEVLALPGKMETVLGMKDAIAKSAGELAVKRSYWATVGSGANKTAADEIRIKLSELCYRTISSDFVEDKKHIDLSAEPLIIVCAAGTRESVLGDIVKDTAIFHAHKAVPVVIVHEGEERFDAIARDVFRVPEVSEHLAPVLTTLVGHLWGYYAALSMNEGSRVLFSFRRELETFLESCRAKEMDLYEVVLEKRFREVVARFYTRFSRTRREGRLPSCLGLDTVTSLTLLLKYLSGRLPVSDFEMDFDVKGTPVNMLDLLFRILGDAINAMARPVDAIKHQAKTVTVGTSRLEETFDGVIFDELCSHGFSVAQLTNSNVLVLKNIQEVIAGVRGGLLYRISGLTVLGEPGTGTRIDVAAKTGILEKEVSRVETDRQLKGTKHIIVREGNVYIGRGRKDGRSFLIIPLLSAGGKEASVIEHILSLHVAFKAPGRVSRLQKKRALGGKFTRIKDLVLESGDMVWDDQYLDAIAIEDLFGDSAEKLAERLFAAGDCVPALAN